MSPETETELRLYTQEQAACLLQCSESHLKRLRRRGQLKFAYLAGRVVYRHADLLDLVNRSLCVGSADAA
jgi:hypothetical protein